MMATDTGINVAAEGVGAQRRASDVLSNIALRWAGGYLLISGFVLALAGHGLVAVVHLAVVVLLVLASRSQATAARLVVDFGPYLIALAVPYAEVPMMSAAFGTGFHDALVQRWELVLFPSNPSQTLAAHHPQRWLSETLHGGYVAYYLALSVPPLMLYARGDREAFAECVLALVVTWIIFCAVFVLFPVAGPRYVWPAPAGIADGPLRTLSLRILAAGSAHGTAFPSLHMAATITQAATSWRLQPRWMRPAMGALIVLVGVGAVYAGYHYAIDMVAGALLGVLVTAGFVAWRRSLSAKSNAEALSAPRGQSLAP
jgi:membrane-associated phospholipid phosphatase